MYMYIEEGFLEMQENLINTHPRAIKNGVLSLCENPSKSQISTIIILCLHRSPSNFVFTLHHKGQKLYKSICGYLVEALWNLVNEPIKKNES